MSSDPEAAAVIRPARAEDAAGCLDIYAPIVRETPISFETQVPSVEEFTRRIDGTMRNYPWLVCEYGGAVAAYAYACRHRKREAYRWSAEVSVYVADARLRHGFGRKIYSELIQILTRQGYANAYAGIALPNPASVAFHQSMGFEEVGVYARVGFKLGRWHDVGWWALRLADGSSQPAEPIPFSALAL